jgi:hypothetical protein
MKDLLEIAVSRLIERQGKGQNWFLVTVLRDQRISTEKTNRAVISASAVLFSS